MTINIISLFPETQLATSAAVLYISPTNTTTAIRKIVFTNTDTAACTFSVYIVPSGSSAGVTNIIISAFSLAPGQAYIASELSAIILGAGASLQALASSANKINAIGTGYTL